MEVTNIVEPLLVYISTFMTINDIVESKVNTRNSDVSIKEIIRSAISYDNIISKSLRNPSKADRFKTIKNIKSYIDEVEKVVVKLLAQKIEFDSQEKDFIYEKGAKFMTLPIEIGHLDDSFHWDEKQLKEFKTLREQTRDVWMKVNTLVESSTNEAPF